MEERGVGVGWGSHEQGTLYDGGGGGSQEQGTLCVWGVGWGGLCVTSCLPPWRARRDQEDGGGAGLS